MPKNIENPSAEKPGPGPQPKPRPAASPEKPKPAPAGPHMVNDHEIDAVKKGMTRVNETLKK